MELNDKTLKIPVTEEEVEKLLGQITLNQSGQRW